MRVQYNKKIKKWLLGGGGGELRDWNWHTYTTDTIYKQTANENLLYSSGDPTQCSAVLCLVVQSCLTLCKPMAVARQAPLSMGFSRQKYWSGLPCPPSGDLPDPGIDPVLYGNISKKEIQKREAMYAYTQLIHFAVW